MTDLALVTADRVSLVEAIGHGRQRTLVASVAVTAGQPVYIDTNGKWAVGDASAAGTAGGAANLGLLHIALKTVAAGEALTAIRTGTIDGYDLTALAYAAPVYLSDTAGKLGDVAGTVSVRVGHVVPALAVSLGTAPDKLLDVDL